jgi:hypothetical protein
MNLFKLIYNQMEEQLIDLMKPIEVNGKNLNLREQFSLIGVENNFSSFYFRSIQCIIQGERSNPKSEKRNAVLTVTDLYLGEPISKPIPD